MKTYVAFAVLAIIAAINISFADSICQTNQCSKTNRCDMIVTNNISHLIYTNFITLSK